MSQAKVDKYKLEKKNRAKVLRRKKINKAIITLVIAGILGGALGYPLGIKLYKDSARRAKEKATISTLLVGQYIDEYLATNYSEIGEGFAILNATNTDASYATSTDANVTTNLDIVE